MKKDGDSISLCLSYACIVCFGLFVIFLLVFCLSTDLYSYKFKILSSVFLALSISFLIAVYFYRPYFLSDAGKYKRLDSLKGEAYEEALERMSAKERGEYLDDLKGQDDTILPKRSPIEIIFDPQNPSKRFWSMVTMKGITAWQYRVEIKNNSSKTLRNVSVTTEHLGKMSMLPADKVFIKKRTRYCDLNPHFSELVAVIHWPIQKKQPGMLSGPSALEYGPIKIIASAKDTVPCVKIFDFDYQTDQMLFERKT